VNDVVYLIEPLIPVEREEISAFFKSASPRPRRSASIGPPRKTCKRMRSDLGLSFLWLGGVMVMELA
jgi:hypothetical protein